MSETKRDRPRLAVTLGDPVGIGSEVILKSVIEGGLDAELVIYGDLGVLEATKVLLGAKPNDWPRLIPTARAPSQEGALEADGLTIIEVSKLDTFVPQIPTPATDRAQLDYIERAVADVRAGYMDALVTAPISKAAIQRAGSPFPGHTEMLAALTAGPGEAPRHPVMMLAGPSLRVVPLTVHVPLAEVPSLIEPGLLANTLRVVHTALQRDFGLGRPRIAVAGLNPHAGEGGMFGDEELRLIEPALREVAKEGISATGPYPADTIFRRAAGGEFDVVVGMYHDQCLIPVKLLDFDRAVNVTLGLTISRTSVDHGTAYDIAGRGVASATSMRSAIELAAHIAQTRRSRGS